MFIIQNCKSLLKTWISQRKFFLIFFTMTGNFTKWKSKKGDPNSFQENSQKVFIGKKLISDCEDQEIS